MSRISQLPRSRTQRSNFTRRTPNRGWAGQVPAASIAVPAASKVLVSQLVLDNDGIDETFLRVVGGIAISSDQSVANEDQVGAIGMCVVTDAAATVGITALPDPVSDVQDDMWFFYQPFAQSFTFNTAVGVDPQFATWYPFDQKAKRIVHSGSQVVVVIANSHATHGFAAFPLFRVLTQVRGT